MGSTSWLVLILNSRISTCKTADQPGVAVSNCQLWSPTIITYELYYRGILSHSRKPTTISRVNSSSLKSALSPISGANYHELVTISYPKPLNPKPRNITSGYPFVSPCKSPAAASASSKGRTGPNSDPAPNLSVSNCQGGGTGFK